MQNTTKMQLNTSTIMNLPIHNYNDEFTFIVNGEAFQTTCLISDLLSPNICKIHSVDPTLCQFIINTKEKGHFSYILNLIKFDPIEFPLNEISFITEVIELLGNNSIELIDKINPPQITKENVFQLLDKHKKNEKYYSKEMLNDINFIASNFVELYITHEKELSNISIDTLLRIVDNPLLQLYDEDQLFDFVSKLYAKNSEYAILFDAIFFSNLSSESIIKFIKEIKFNDLSKIAWIELSTKLEEEHNINKYNIGHNKNSNYDYKTNQYRYEKIKTQGITFSPKPDKPFHGIFKYLMNQSNKKIETKVNATSKNKTFLDVYNPFCAMDTNELMKFRSANGSDQYICFEFRENEVSPTHYTIKNSNGNDTLKSWILEGSLDNKSWEILDEQSNCTYLMKPTSIHTFAIKNQTQKKYKYIKLRQTGPNWNNNDALEFNSFEIYGTFFLNN